MENILSKYQYNSHYKENEELRESFNALTERVYGFNFKAWYEAGYWQERYIPYSLVDGDKIVANVSVNIIEFMVLNEPKIYVQIGTVMTDQAYRGQGLSRFLMEKVIEEWEPKCDLMYLFANDSVLNFYPKFKFRAFQEYQYSTQHLQKNGAIQVKKLDMSDEANRDLLYEVANQTVPLSSVSMQKNASLIMFYCISFMNNFVYYIEEYQSIVVFEVDEEIIYLYDVFSLQPIDLDLIVEAIVAKETKKVIFGFTPSDRTHYERSLLQQEDTTLFVRMGKDNPFETELLSFPILSHA